MHNLTWPHNRANIFIFHIWIHIIFQYEEKFDKFWSIYSVCNFWSRGVCDEFKVIISQSHHLFLTNSLLILICCFLQYKITQSVKLHRCVHYVYGSTQDVIDSPHCMYWVRAGMRSSHWAHQNQNLKIGKKDDFNQFKSYTWSKKCTTLQMFTGIYRDSAGGFLQYLQEKTL